MKCHYVYDEKAGWVLIPECWTVVISGDIDDCTCEDVASYKEFEKKEYNEMIKKRNQEIKELQKENERLTKQIKHLVDLIKK